MRAEPVQLPLEQIKTHVAFLGSPGSGKTTAALAMIEGLLERGVSALLVDRKGDLARYASKSLREFREEIEAEFIRMKLAELGWNISKTAQVLGIERTNLHKKLRALGIHRGEDD